MELTQNSKLKTQNLIPSATARIEIRVVNSRFIASAGPARSVAEAKSFIAAIRAEMPDASHHVYAYIIGHGTTTTLGMSDDGEPSGTAGRPALAILRGSGLGDVVLVVTRYFGGTLLGTGGLVHAYGDATRAVLEILPRTEKIQRDTLLISLPYTSYESARRLTKQHAGQIESEDFAAEVTLVVILPSTQSDAYQHTLQELSSGQAQIVHI